jgi:hypothetical protein
MKTVTLILFAAALLAAQDRSHKDASPNKDSGTTNATQSIPAGATQIEPNFYRYTDTKGKTWMYRRTPFGFSTWEDKPDPQPAVEETNPVVATDLGDSVRFERKTPFGDHQWVKKKTELTLEEKGILDASKSGHKAPATGQTTETR